MSNDYLLRCFTWEEGSWKPITSMETHDLARIYDFIITRGDKPKKGLYRVRDESKQLLSFEEFERVVHRGPAVSFVPVSMPYLTCVVHPLTSYWD